MNEDNDLKLKEEFELREKRLNLVFKILYIVAALWGALFLSYMSNTKTAAASLYCGLLAVLTTSIINILYFIFRELRCLKISSNTEIAVKNLADDKYIEIWNTFGVSLFASMILLWINTVFTSYITQHNLSIFLTIFIIIAQINVYFIKHKKTKYIIHNIAILFICYAFLAVAQL